MMKVLLLLAGYLAFGCGCSQSTAACSLHPGHDRQLCQNDPSVLVKHVFAADTADAVDELSKA